MRLLAFLLSPQGLQVGVTFPGSLILPMLSPAEDWYQLWGYLWRRGLQQLWCPSLAVATDGGCRGYSGQT